MGEQQRQDDLVILGTGCAAAAAAVRCRAAGWTVAVIDARPFGGTCALRGCHPKKMRVSAVEVIDATARMAGKGVRTHSVAIDWQELIPTVSLVVTSAVVCTYGCDDGRISPTRCAIIDAGLDGR
jgi:pyruvate/2-oxoglutarate dehydrogenase complex dihydrolipoamide dehydrogenase (E3) component